MLITRYGDTINYRLSIFEITGLVKTKPHPFYDSVPRAPLAEIVRNMASTSTKNIAYKTKQSGLNFAAFVGTLQIQFIRNLAQGLVLKVS